MPRKNLNVDGKIGCKVRKRRCSSSSLVHNYRLKRAFLVGKRGASSTPVLIWKMMRSNSPLLEKHASKGKELLVSARKLAATMWEINGARSPIVKMDNLEDKMSKLGVFRKERILKSDSIYSPISERMDLLQKGSHRRRASSGSRKLLQPDGNLRDTNSNQNCLVEVYQTQNHALSPCHHITKTKNRLKDVYNSLITSKELCKLMSRIEQQNSTCLSLVTALKFEVDRAYIQVHKLIQEQKTNFDDIDITLKQFEEEKLVWKLKQDEKTHRAIMSMAEELETEKRLRRQSDRLNKKLGKELAETKESLSSEKRVREILEQVCDELARGIGEDKVEVEELKRQSEKVREEMEKEREMLQLADVLREERVQMKLQEAKYEFEEKNELVDKLRSDLEAYLKSKMIEEQESGSPSHEKIKELEKYLRETLPSSYQHQDNKKDNNEAIIIEEEEEDSADIEFHSIELNVNDKNSLQWNDALRNGSNRDSVEKSNGKRFVSDKTKKQTISSEAKFTDGIEWEFTTNGQENQDMFNKRGMFEFEPRSWKKDAEDEMERYNMIKDLRDHIVSGSRMASSQDLASRDIVSSKCPNGLVCEG